MAGTIITGNGERLDQIARRVYGTWTGGIVERLLSVNPHLPEQSAVLPAGVSIYLPDPPAPKKIKQTVKLWG